MYTVLRTRYQIPGTCLKTRYFFVCSRSDVVGTVVSLSNHISIKYSRKLLGYVTKYVFVRTVPSVFVLGFPWGLDLNVLQNIRETKTTLLCVGEHFIPNKASIAFPGKSVEDFRLNRSKVSSVGVRPYFLLMT